MVPKQVVDIIDMANSVNNISKEVELDTLSTSELKPVMSLLPTQIFSIIEKDGVHV